MAALPLTDLRSQRSHMEVVQLLIWIFETEQ